MTKNTPCLRKKIPTLLTISATAFALLMLASPLVFSNPLLQPAQAQTSMSFRTVGQAQGTDMGTGQTVGLTFDAHGTSSTPEPSLVDITNGTIQLQASPPDGQTYTGNIRSGTFRNNTAGGDISFIANITKLEYKASSACSSSERNNIQLSNEYGETDFTGPVECTSSSQGGGGNTTTTTTQQSSAPTMTGTTAQDKDSKDGDGDGIPDSNDNCPHNSDHRCFKEGDTTSSTTTTHEQQPSSSSSPSSGNQTR